MTNGNYPVGRPELDTGKEMHIGAYFSPEPSDNSFKLVKDCGMTHLLVNETEHNHIEDDDYVSKTLGLAKKHGLKIIYHCFNKSYKILKKHFDEIRNDKTCTGIFVWDEPPIQEIDFLAEEYKDFVKDFPDLPYYVNTWPMYSCKEQRGIQSYYQYLNAYAEKLVRNYKPEHRTFWCDIYPMLVNYGIYDKWLFNVEYVKDLAEREHADLYLFYITQAFSDRRQQSKACEFIFQTNVYLAYGVKGLSYCPYLTNGGPEYIGYPGVVYLNGTPTPVYPLVKENNEYIKKIDGIYLGFTWKGIMSRIGYANKTGKNENFSHCNNFIYSFGILDEVNSSQDSLIGCFENEQGYEGYMVVNFTEPLFNIENKIDMTFRGVDKAIIYVNGEPCEKDLKDGKLELTLGGGEGAFVVPYKK